MFLLVFYRSVTGTVSIMKWTTWYFRGVWLGLCESGRISLGILQECSWDCKNCDMCDVSLLILQECDWDFINHEMYHLVFYRSVARTVWIMTCVSWYFTGVWLGLCESGHVSLGILQDCGWDCVNQAMCLLVFYRTVARTVRIITCVSWYFTRLWLGL